MGHSQVTSATMSVYEATVGFVFVYGVGDIVNGGCSPLPTHPLFCDPVTLFYVVCRHFYLIVLVNPSVPTGQFLVNQLFRCSKAPL